jgi:hypothetical protein
MYPNSLRAMITPKNLSPYFTSTIPFSKTQGQSSFRKESFFVNSKNRFEGFN